MGEVSLDDYDEDDAGREPEEGDYIIWGDTWYGVSIVTVGGDRERVATVDDARETIAALMRRDKFYPTVWVAHDRGDPMVDDEFTYPSEVLHG